MGKGRPRKYADAAAAKVARRDRRQQAQGTVQPSRDGQLNPALQVLPATTVPGEIVWNLTTEPMVEIDRGPQHHDPLLEDLIASVDADGFHSAAPLADDDSHGALESFSVSGNNLETPPPAISQPSSVVVGEPPLSPPVTANHIHHEDDLRPSSPGHADLPLHFSSIHASTQLPATSVAHFLAVQFLSVDPAQTLPQLSRDLPGTSEDLVRSLDDLQDTPIPNAGDDLLSPADGLEHIRSHYDEYRQVPDIITQPSLARPDIEYTEDEWRYLFTGYTCEEDRAFRPQIDPRVSNTQDGNISVEFDIDSLIIFTSHLGTFRQGLLWYPAQIPTGAITSAMHLNTRPVRYTDSHGHVHQRRMPLHHIPNYCFARLPGTHAITVHWFFPHLYEPGQVSIAEKSGQRLSDHQFAQWMDRIVLPSLQECLPPGRLQHLPASFQHAKANTRAFYVETHRSTKNTGAHHQNIQYKLPAMCLSALQDAITRRIRRPGNMIFAESFLLINGKGLKLQSWKTPSLSRTLDCFSVWLGVHFNGQYLSEEAIHVDVGKETLCSRPQTLL